MSARIVSLCILVTVWSVPAGVVKAQSKPGEPSTPAAADAVTQAQLKEALGALETRLDNKLDALSNALNGPQERPPVEPPRPPRSGPVTREEINELWNALYKNTGSIAKNEGKINANTAHLEQKQDEIRKLTNVVVDNRARISQITKAVGPVGSPYTLDLKGLMNTRPAFREEMKDAVQRSLDRFGTLEVENRMGTSQLLRINQRDEWIPPYSARTFEGLPVGTLTTELVGYEAAKHLTITAPTYRQRLVIAASPRPTRSVDLGWVSDRFVWQYDPFTGTWWRRLP